ncbi:hypothetical protein BC940DRAFT_308986 [Gongronella butleri]|nr:hypothetical protein BC940DRAFT_308986 [Gongronella butleri]
MGTRVDPRPHSGIPVSEEEHEQLYVAWHKSLGQFLTSVGLEETRQCFDTELLVMSSFYRAKLPGAMETLVDHLLHALEKHVSAKETITLGKKARENDENGENDEKSDDPTKDLLDKPRAGKRQRVSKGEDALVDVKEEKVDQIDAAKDGKDDKSAANDDADADDDEFRERARQLDPDQVQLRASDRQVQERISAFIQMKRKDVDASNRAEFLSRPDPKGDDVTCARVDAREINRNIQMKFDIVNNEDGPLLRSTTLHTKSDETTQDNSSSIPSSLAEREADLVRERLDNIEQHVHIRFEPHDDRPFTVMERIKIIEQTLIDIEQRYPLWAAVHFNQPNRTYPPPPPLTYITRPQAPQSTNTANVATKAQKPKDYVPLQIVPTEQAAAPSSGSGGSGTGGGGGGGRAPSSLTRAVLQQLDRQRQQQSSS